MGGVAREEPEEVHTIRRCEWSMMRIYDCVIVSLSGSKKTSVKVAKVVWLQPELSYLN